MPEKAKELIKKHNIKTSTGTNYLDNLTGFDVIFRSPSFLPTNKYLLKDETTFYIYNSNVSYCSWSYGSNWI